MFRCASLLFLCSTFCCSAEHGGKAYGFTVTVADGYGWTAKELGDPKDPQLLLVKDGGQKVIVISMVKEGYEKAKSLRNFTAGMASTAKGMEFGKVVDFDFKGAKVESKDLKQEKEDGTLIVGTAFVCKQGEKTLMVATMSGIVQPRENEEMNTILTTITVP